MSRLYSKLGQLQRELLKPNLTEDERQEIEDEIEEIEYQLELEESNKYDDSDEDY